MNDMKYFLLIVLAFGFSFCSDSSQGSQSAPVDGEAMNSDNLSTTGTKILFFGDSLTAGLGLNQPELEAWPSLLGERLQREGHDVQIWNAGLSGDTTSGGLSRLSYSLQQRPDIFLLELGANDSMRGVPISEIRKNLGLIIETVQSRYPDTKILLVGIKTFPNLGSRYRKEFDSLFQEISRDKNLPLVPFLLEGVAGDRILNQKDGIHPTAEGHKIMAETVYPYLKKLL
jgi:acyl-CoA thioesterase-1